MTDIDAPARYAEPAADQTSREGNVGLVVALALGLAVAAVALAMISREMAEPFVLAILGGLAVVGVFCLFAGAVGILHFGQSQARNDVTKAFVDNLPQGALIADQSGRVLYANEAYRNLLGLEPGMRCAAARPRLCRQRRISPSRSSACRARPSRAGALREEFRLPPLGEAEEDPGVRPRWFRISVQPMPAEPGAGRKGGLVVWQVDEVTSDRERQEAGFEKVQQAIAYLDNAPAGFFTADGDGTIDYLNATLAQWLGLDLAEVAGGHAQARQDHVRGRRGAHRARPAAAQTQGDTRRFDIDLVKADGTTLPVRILHCLPRHGALAHALVLNRAPGSAEEAAAAELRFARLFNSAPIAIATVDREGTISATNAAFVRLFGRAVDGVPARKVTLASLADADGAESLAQGARRGHRRAGHDRAGRHRLCRTTRSGAGASISAPSSGRRAKARRPSPTPSTPPSSARSKCRSPRARRCRPSASSPAASRTTSTTC